MRILFASGTPLAGVSELMTRMVNRYLAPEHEAACLSRGPGKHKWYVRPGVRVPCFDIKNKHQVNSAVNWADVIHCMANVSARTMRRMDTLKTKVWVFQWHGAQIWPFERVWLPEDFLHVKWIHIGQGWHRAPWFEQFKKFGLKVIPNVISAEDEIHVPLPWRKRRGYIAFSPSNQKPGAVNKKGIPEVKKACKGRPLSLILGRPFEECMRAKRQAILGIDEVVTPLYHRSALEFLSQGVPCICSYDDFTIDCLKEVTGSDLMPFINATPKSLSSVIATYMDLEDRAKEEMSIAARSWIERYYHPKDLLKRYMEVYTS